MAGILNRQIDTGSRFGEQPAQFLRAFCGYEFVGLPGGNQDRRSAQIRE